MEVKIAQDGRGKSGCEEAVKVVQPALRVGRVPDHASQLFEQRPRGKSGLSGHPANGCN